MARLSLSSLLWPILVCSLIVYVTASRQALESSSNAHCYESLKTLSEDTPIDANCFEVSKNGLISRVFKDQSTSRGHVYPGLWDGHGHLLQYGESLQSADLFGSKSLDEALSRVKEYSNKHLNTGTKVEWIRGVGWDQAAFGRMPMAVCLIPLFAFFGFIYPLGC